MSLPIPTDMERVDLNDDETVDDVAISIGGGMFRLEQLSGTTYWMRLYMPDGSPTDHVFHIRSKAKVKITYRVEERS